MNQGKKAFTLVEVLVVIAIIAILSAILLPVFGSVRASAKQTACASNMSQVGVALAAYMAEYDENWVCGTLPSDIGPNDAPQQMWIGYDNNNAPLTNGYYGDMSLPATHEPRSGAIDQYLKDRSVRKCPAMSGGRQLVMAMNSWNTSTASPYFTTNPAAKGKEYGPASKETGILPNGQIYHIGAPHSDVERPAETLILWEHLDGVPLCNSVQEMDTTVFLDNEQNRAHFEALHRNCLVGLFADGHAKRLILGQLKRSMFSCRKDIYPN
jgi:prepilin-type N-terminal cleavage/methylation domain-containing protein